MLAAHVFKGTVFDVTGNKAYGPEGSYKGGYSTSLYSSDLTLTGAQYLPGKMLRGPSRSLR